MSDHGRTRSTPAPSACGGRASPARAMGNSLGARLPTSGSSSKRDRDAFEVRTLLELSPALARYSTFDGLNTPSFHFTAAKDHLDIVMMLLDKGANVNARNYYGQSGTFDSWGLPSHLLPHQPNTGILKIFARVSCATNCVICNHVGNKSHQVAHGEIGVPCFYDKMATCHGTFERVDDFCTHRSLRALPKPAVRMGNRVVLLGSST